MTYRYVSRRDDGIYVHDFGDLEVLFRQHVESTVREALEFFEQDRTPQHTLILTPKLRTVNFTLDPSVFEGVAHVIRRSAWLCPDTIVPVIGQDIVKYVAEMWEVKLFRSPEAALAWLKT